MSTPAAIVATIEAMSKGNEGAQNTARELQRDLDELLAHIEELEAEVESLQERHAQDLQSTIKLTKELSQATLVNNRLRLSWREDTEAEKQRADRWHREFELEAAANHRIAEAHAAEKQRADDAEAEVDRLRSILTPSQRKRYDAQRGKA